MAALEGGGEFSARRQADVGDSPNGTMQTDTGPSAPGVAPAPVLQRAGPMSGRAGSPLAQARPVLGPAHWLLWRVLNVRARGRKNAKPRELLFAIMREDPNEGGDAVRGTDGTPGDPDAPSVAMGDRRLRRLREELLAAGKRAFSGPDGYYAGVDHADTLAFLAYLRDKIRPLEDERAAAVEAERLAEAEAAGPAKATIGRQTAFDLGAAPYGGPR